MFEILILLHLSGAPFSRLIFVQVCLVALWVEMPISVSVVGRFVYAGFQFCFQPGYLGFVA